MSNPERPVQIIIAGKAHPEDRAGQALIQEWIRFIRQPETRSHIVFLADYDMLLTEHLVQGVDVWLNTPRRPWEASGTSGMKVLVNGGINLSELDGWWAEAYTPELGWALGDGQEHGDDPAWDAVEAEALYNLLEREVIPEFYMRDRNGIPDCLGRAHARKHGPVDPALFGLPHSDASTPSNTTSRLQQAIASVRATEARPAGRCSAGGVRSSKNGPRSTLAE